MFRNSGCLPSLTTNLQPPNHQKQTMPRFFINNTNAMDTIKVPNNFTVGCNRSNILA